jgi:putative redox protein
MNTSIDLNWKGNMSFETNLNGHKLVLDASPEVGGENKGFRPKPLMMVSLAGCTGMDIASILRKMKVKFDDLSIRVEADLTEEHPKQYTAMHLKYTFKGKKLPLNKLERAIELSQNKYCGVSATLKNSVEITYEIIIIES